MKLPIFKKLVISGGGIKGLAICGAIDVLQSNNILDKIEEIYGSSIGAYIAFFLCIGISSKNICEIIKVDLTKLQDFDMRRFLTEWGFDDGNKFANFVNATIKTAGYEPNITFTELAVFSKYKLFICGTNINKSQPIYFSVDTHPDMEIRDALRISGGYPFAFTPINIDGDLYSDGAIMCPLPCNIISEKDKEQTLCIAIHKSFNRYQTDSIYKYLMSIISCIIDSLTEQNINSMKHVIKISYPLHAMAFDISLDEKEKVIKCGEDSVKEWLDNFTSPDIKKPDLTTKKYTKM